MNYVNRLLTLNEEVVAKHASSILKQLGMENDNDGILDRIVVSSKIGNETPNGVFTSVYTAKGIMGIRGTTYNRGSGNIELYPCMQMHIRGNKRLIKIPAGGLLMHLFSKQIERTLIFILAHELRHYWQYYTNTIYTRSGGMRTSEFMPYEYRWEEVDANEFATEYMKSLSK